MGLLNRKEASVQEVCEACLCKLRTLVTSSAQPGLQFKDECKQLHRFAKSVIIPLEDLSDNTFTAGSARAAAVRTNVKQVEAATDRGQALVGQCEALGRLQCLFQAEELAAGFANVCQDLQAALAALDVSAAGCDAITCQQVAVTLAQLSQVQAHITVQPQQVVIELRALAEALRVERKAATGGKESPAVAATGAGPVAARLQEAVANVLDGCAAACSRSNITQEPSHPQSCVGQGFVNDTSSGLLENVLRPNMHHLGRWKHNSALCLQEHCGAAARRSSRATAAGGRSRGKKQLCRGFLLQHPTARHQRARPA